MAKWTGMWQGRKVYCKWLNTLAGIISFCKWLNIPFLVKAKSTTRYSVDVMGGTQNWVVWQAGPTAIKHSSSHNSFICFISTSACYNCSDYAPLRPFLIFICLVSCLQRGWGKEQTSGTHWLTAFLDFHPSISFIEWRLFCEKKQWHRYQRASTRNMQSCFSKCCWLSLLQLYTAALMAGLWRRRWILKDHFLPRVIRPAL